MRITMQKNEKEMTINDAMEDYKRHMIVNNFSVWSMDLIKRVYKDFNEFINNENYLILDVNYRTIQDYIIWLKEKNNKDTTINIKLSNLRMFFYWCMNNDYLDEFKINLVKQVQTIKETYSEKQLELLLKKPDVKKCMFSEFRDYTIISLLLGTGVRCNTVLNMKIQDLNFSDYLIKLETLKNKKQQLVPMSINLANILIDYLKVRGGKPEDFLFVNVDEQPLTRPALKASIRTYNLKRGVNITSLHAFRHTFAKMFILNKGDAFVLQRLLGHSTMEMTRRYVNLYAEDLQENYSEYNPLDVFLKKHNKGKINMRDNNK